MECTSIYSYQKTDLSNINHILISIMTNYLYSGWALQKEGRYDEAMIEYEKASEAGHNGAKFHLNCMYFERNCNHNKIVDWDKISMSAEEFSELKVCYLERDSEKEIQNSLGLLHEYIAHDYQRAFSYYELSATQGYSYAQNNMGHVYFEGIGVPNDYEKAYKWYLLAISQGIASAHNQIAVMFYLKLIAPEMSSEDRYNEARKWLKLSIEVPYTKGCFNLGQLYTDNSYSKRNYGKAIKYYNLSLKRGNVVAQRCLDFFKNLRVTITEKLDTYFQLNPWEGVSYLFFCNFISYLTKMLKLPSGFNVICTDPIVKPDLKACIVDYCTRLAPEFEETMVETWFSELYGDYIGFKQYEHLLARRL